MTRQLKFKVLFLFIIFLLISGLLFAQEVVPAGRFMEQVSQTYGSFRDFEATINIRSGNMDMVGTISHLSPSLLRIDFTRPANQVINFNGELLTIFLPDFRVTLNQTISRRRGGGQGTSGMGLALLRRNYTPSYVTGPEPEPLDPNSSERVVKLRLRRSSAAEGFSEIILSVNPQTKIIRRMEGRTLADTMVIFDFTNVRTNQGIPSQRFLYDPPASANIFNNFLFRDQS